MAGVNEIDETTFATDELAIDQLAVVEYKIAKIELIELDVLKAAFCESGGGQLAVGEFHFGENTRFEDELSRDVDLSIPRTATNIVKTRSEYR